MINTPEMVFSFSLFLSCRLQFGLSNLALFTIVTTIEALKTRFMQLKTQMTLSNLSHTNLHQVFLNAKRGRDVVQLLLISK